MPVSRMRMRPWLEKQLESASIKDVKWLDREKMVFSIPWKHAARHGWELDKDACLFKLWAIHTGKYVEGHASDPKTWKANFRCAMNSLPDIEEVKDKSINKGHQAVRVYRMLPSPPKCRDKHHKAKETRKRRKSTTTVKMEEESDYSDTQSPGNVESTQENRVDSTVGTEPEELPFELSHEVPEVSLSVEIEGNYGAEFFHRFEVSPDHSPDHDSDIIKICRELESESFMFGNLNDRGFQSNEACTSSESSWSDTSSDFDELPQYLTLGSDFLSSSDVDYLLPFSLKL